MIGFDIAPRPFLFLFLLLLFDTGRARHMIKFDPSNVRVGTVRIT